MEKLNEILLQLRYYGNLRFAMLAVFAAVTAGLLTAFFRESASSAFRFFLALFGGGTSLIFACLQVKLGATHQGLIDHLSKLATASSDQNQELVRVLLGLKIEHRLDDLLGKVKEAFLKIPGAYAFAVPKQGTCRYLGPINMLVLLLHFLAALVWLCFFILNLIIWFCSIFRVSPFSV